MRLLLLFTIVITKPFMNFSWLFKNTPVPRPPIVWDLLNKNLKITARNFFIKSAENSGVPWKSMVQQYESQLEILKSYKNKYENRSLVYPSYYTKPFHGYNSGNMNWQAAIEAKAATLSVSSRYWTNTNPYLAEQYMRNNATKAIRSYIYHQTNTPIRSILDMGSSTGISTQYIQKAFPDSTVIGVELSPYFLSVALYDSDQFNDRIRYLHANVEEVPLPDKSFDLINCQFLFHEVPYMNTLSILKEANRLLKPEGVLAILDLNPYQLKSKINFSQFRLWAFESTEPHIFEYYSHDMKTTLYECGFESIVQIKNDPMNLLWIARKGGVRIQTPKQSSARRMAFEGNQMYLP